MFSFWDFDSHTQKAAIEFLNIKYFSIRLIFLIKFF